MEGLLLSAQTWARAGALTCTAGKQAQPQWGPAWGQRSWFCLCLSSLSASLCLPVSRSEVRPGSRGKVLSVEGDHDLPRHWWLSTVNHSSGSAEFMCPFICFLSSYYVPGCVLAFTATAVRKQMHFSPSQACYPCTAGGDRATET